MIADRLGEIKERANRVEKDRFDHRRRLNVQSSTSNTNHFRTRLETGLSKVERKLATSRERQPLCRASPCHCIFIFALQIGSAVSHDAAS
jgi:hypothetical protein